MPGSTDEACLGGPCQKSCEGKTVCANFCNKSRCGNDEYGAFYECESQGGNEYRWQLYCGRDNLGHVNCTKEHQDSCAGAPPKLCNNSGDADCYYYDSGPYAGCRGFNETGCKSGDIISVTCKKP